jgi:N6-adenosine-specific RNA methylase IME4
VRDLQPLIDAGESFRCIYADPPWRFDNRASRGAAAKHYSTMSVEEICAMPVSELAASNAHLHLWTTNSFLFDAKRVIDAWGFRYKCCFVWVKDQMGLGNYWRNSHELMLLGVRGRLRFEDPSLRSWLQATRTSHSTKPDKIREFAERASPAPRLELFGRRSCPGWTVYGNRVEPRLF